MKRICLSWLFLTAIQLCSTAQNITGSWEGLMIDEFLKINIIQVDAELCGYTYDVGIDDRKSHCKAYFEGYYDNKNRIWTINGTEFMENSGEHVLMTIKMWQINKKEKNVLRALVFSNNPASAKNSQGKGDYFFVRKTAETPLALPGNQSVCFPKKIQKENETVVAKTHQGIINKKGKKNIQTDSSILRKDHDPITVNSHKTIEDLSQNKALNTDSMSIVEMKNRKNDTLTILNVENKMLELKIYDNGIVDDDTVTIFFDGKLICSKQRLNSTPLKFNFDIGDTSIIHELVMFAVNLGSIPPNTAIIVVNAGEKRYELRSSANLEENVLLRFKYSPLKPD